ncbi:hypothetical protein KC19_10G160300 [Ceratodon purpureus]|uniref:NADH:flavin oxidoreductase/NADH oxidase N-terminal domain-containing protein n=1 Tax=Ceratodon purpureus TaxID=3225 RepID=A0A8T0GNX0_CERPU|nr:hypothetical protein KC19_10G160300 [Ceratodon purpureus]
MGHGAQGSTAAVENGNGKMPLFTPMELGPFKLNHRVIMAPLTRCRSTGYVPQEIAAVYYGQRASPGGLVIAEATGISESAQGFPNAPGIWSKEQVEAWKPVVKAVHDKGAIFFCQIWHVGRVSHTAYHNGAAPPSSTAQRVINGQVTLPDGETAADFSTPRAIDTSEVAQYVEYFRTAARNAIEAGFDGVEIHGAHGYLIEQFLKDSVNDRTDKYGGSLSNRSRFMEEVVEAVVKEVGAERVGMRISPFTTIWDASDSDPSALGLHIANTLNKYNLLYLHVIEPRFTFAGADDFGLLETENSLWPIRRAYEGTFIAAGGFTRESGNDAIASGRVDAIVYGRYFISNPDLPKRFELGAPLNKYNRETFYNYPKENPSFGYTDYPTLDETTETK